MNRLPDRRLAGRARRGDHRALEALYDRYRGRLFGFLVRACGDRAAAEDLFQEVWLKVIQAVNGFDPNRGSFRAWLYRIAANAAVDRARRAAVRSGPDLDARVGEGEERRIDFVPSGDPGPDRMSAGREAGKALAVALADLPENRRTAFLLKHQQGLTYQEVAAAMGIPEGTVKTMVHRAVESLRRALGVWREE